MEKPLNFIVLGISGAGKGTQVKLLKEKLSAKQRTFVVSTGDLMRALKRRDTAIGSRAKEIIKKGSLLPSMVSVAEWLHAIAWDVREEEGIIFDGAPRKVWEAEIMDETLAFINRQDTTKVIFLQAGVEEITQRLLKRGREDDEMSAIQGRITYYNEHVLPVVDYYRWRQRLIEINGEQSIEAVHAD